MMSGNKLLNKKNNGQKYFEKYWSENLLKQGLEKGQLIKGSVKISPKNYTYVYVPHPDGGADVFINGGGPFNDRNRAMDGDIVAVLLHAPHLWRVNLRTLKQTNKDIELADDDSDQLPTVTEFIQNDKYAPQIRQTVAAAPSHRYTPKSYLIRTGRVVAIIERKHSCIATGHLHYQNKYLQYAFFIPTDSRVPRMQVPLGECPDGFADNPQQYENTMFIVQISQWLENSQYPRGHLLRALGCAGDIKAETEGILAENRVDNSDFSTEITDSLPQNWTIPEEEVKARRDLRDLCIFTIDPITARDLDDAVHCKRIDEDTYEVGVHIADVSYFVPRDTPLDREAASRATSVYLVQTVVPMLPRELCKHLCSLQPNTDRLTVSVIWTMTARAEVLNVWCGRSIIHSCAQLAYSHAQSLIDDPSSLPNPSNFPQVANGFSIRDVQSRINILHKLSQTLRERAKQNGTLSLNQAKVQFYLSPDTGLPYAHDSHDMTESQQLIQELMLLANKTVASLILKAFPDKAILRRHPAPQDHQLYVLQQKCSYLRTPIDTRSAGTIQVTWQPYMGMGVSVGKQLILSGSGSFLRCLESLDGWSGESPEEIARMKALINICSKPMKNALYFCSGENSDPHYYHHYALNCPLYTHFTSPIRRYADIMVHRLLLAASDCRDVPDSVAALERQAEHCNDRKAAAKRAAEQSTDLYIALYVRETGPRTERGVVVDVLDHSFDVYLLELSVMKRVYLQTIDAAAVAHQNSDAPNTIDLVWPPDDRHKQEVSQTIRTYDVVTLLLKSGDKPLKWLATLIHPSAIDAPDHSSPARPDQNIPP